MGRRNFDKTKKTRIIKFRKIVGSYFEGETVYKDDLLNKAAYLDVSVNMKRLMSILKRKGVNIIA